MRFASSQFTVAHDWEKRPQDHDYAEAVGVAVDSRDRVYVLTRQPGRVSVYDSDGRFREAWGAGTFTDRTHGITIDAEDNVFIVDDADHTVRKFTTAGELLMTLGTSGVPSNSGYDGQNLDSIERGAGPFNRPTNLSVGRDGSLFVTDGYGNARVHRFSADGALMTSWGAPGSGPGEFQLAHGILALDDGRILVADRENDRIQIFDEEGRYQTAWTDVQRPTQVALDPRRGTIAVSELCWRRGQRSYVHGVMEDLPSRVSVMDLEGNVVDRWGAPEGCAPGNLFAAHGLCFDSVGSLYVAEVVWTIGVKSGLAPPDCHALQKFVPIP